MEDSQYKSIILILLVISVFYYFENKELKNEYENLEQKYDSLNKSYNELLIKHNKYKKETSELIAKYIGEQIILDILGLKKYEMIIETVKIISCNEYGVGC